jgi:hypothetical protein
MSFITSALTVVGRHRVIAAGVGAIVIAILVAILVWPSNPPSPPVAYTNISRNYKTCLLSTTQDAAESAPVWKAIQDATAHAPVNAQQLTPPVGNTDQLTPYFNSLIALRCQLIVSVGDDLADALVITAASNPRLHFLNIGSPTHQANIHTIPTPLTKPDSVTEYVLAATRGAY